MKYYINFYPRGVSGEGTSPESYAYEYDLPPVHPSGVHIEVDIPPKPSDDLKILSLEKMLHSLEERVAKLEEGDPQRCSACIGSGYLYRMQGRGPVKRTCNLCGGTGWQ